MALPLLLIGVAAATGTFGVGSTIKAGFDANTAKNVNQSANEIVQNATDWVNAQRLACGRSLSQLGEEKLFVLGSTVTEFLDCFQKIKNVDFKETEGLDELKKMHLDDHEFVELRSLVNFAGSLAGGAVAGTAGGALAAFGAYGAAQALAFASTGTAISALSGAAATNATLAFFGGGSLAAGGLGMAGGTAVLGGLVAGPALMVMGLVAGSAAKKNLEQAYTNRSEAIQIASELNAAGLQCEAIRRRTYLFYNLLARLDTYFLPLIYRMEGIVEQEGDNYRNYAPESKKVIASCASVAVSVKSVLDTPLLTDDGLLTGESGERAESIEGFLEELAGAEREVQMVSLKEAYQKVIYAHPDEYVHCINEFKDCFAFILLNKGEDAKGVTFFSEYTVVKKESGQILEHIFIIDDMVQGEYKQYTKSDLDTL